MPRVRGHGAPPTHSRRLWRWEISLSSSSCCCSRRLFSSVIRSRRSSTCCVLAMPAVTSSSSSFFARSAMWCSRSPRRCEFSRTTSSVASLRPTISSRCPFSLASDSSSLLSYATRMGERYLGSVSHNGSGVPSATPSRKPGGESLLGLAWPPGLAAWDRASSSDSLRIRSSKNLTWPLSSVFAMSRCLELMMEPMSTRRREGGAPSSVSACTPGTVSPTPEEAMVCASGCPARLSRATSGVPWRLRRRFLG
mmetsp:Transcript_12270/g.38882  ORF Transcript_12270/g.38882 Transcript_12270/m.38882 type:complete len:252 (+) Transcript_12270:1739-2494(+)